MILQLGHKKLLQPPAIEADNNLVIGSGSYLTDGYINRYANTMWKAQNFEIPNAGNYTLESLTYMRRKTGTLFGSLEVSLCYDNSGQPGSIWWQKTSSTMYISTRWHERTETYGSITLSGQTPYWFIFKMYNNTTCYSYKYMSVGYINSNQHAGGNWHYSNAGSYWYDYSYYDLWGYLVLTKQ